MNNRILECGGKLTVVSDTSIKKECIYRGNYRALEEVKLICSSMWSCFTTGTGNVCTHLWTILAMSNIA